MSANGKILYIGDSEPPAALDLVLEGQGYQIFTATDLKHALNVLRLRDFEAMVVEESLIHRNQDEWREFSGRHLHIPVLGISERVPG